MTSKARPITISLHALGGQGGGVLADWLVRAARRSHWRAQGTSVPGVAQRTGATVYYLEFFPESAIADREPVLALAPTPGEVDLVVASEVMEAGRALNRGLVTARTTLVLSESRIYAIAEKSGLGDARIDPEPVLRAARSAAGRLIVFDMEAEAARTHSVISAVLLGAIAGSNALPFHRRDFEAAIEESGIAVAANLAGFTAGFDGAGAERPEGRPVLAPAARSLMAEGEARVCDYQDAAYGALYRARLARFAERERADGLLSQELARYLALWMSYEDVARVAELKTRPARFARIRDETGARPGDLVHVVDYLHPRLQEVCDALPAPLGAFVLRTPWLSRVIARLFARGRHIRSSGVRGFLLLSCMARLKRWRRGSLRYLHENAKIEAWLERVFDMAGRDYDLAVEIARCQRLVKGYGDTYDRGWRNFSTLMHMAEKLDAASLARLRVAALADDEGRALQEAISALA